MSVTGKNRRLYHKFVGMTHSLIHLMFLEFYNKFNANRHCCILALLVIINLIVENH